MSLISPFDIVIITQKDNAVNYSPFISGIIGLIGVFLGYWLKEKNENNQEEYSALLTTKELLEASPINEKEIREFYNKLRFDLRARRLKTYKIMVKALLNEIENNDQKNADQAEEYEKINSRLRKLRDGGILSKIKKKILRLYIFSTHFLNNHFPILNSRDQLFSRFKRK